MKEVEEYKKRRTIEQLRKTEERNKKKQRQGLEGMSSEYT